MCLTGAPCAPVVPWAAALAPHPAVATAITVAPAAKLSILRTIPTSYALEHRKSRGAMSDPGRSGSGRSISLGDRLTGCQGSCVASFESGEANQEHSGSPGGQNPEAGPGRDR